MRSTDLAVYIDWLVSKVIMGMWVQLYVRSKPWSASCRAEAAELTFMHARASRL